MIDLFHPPRPPDIREGEAAVVHRMFTGYKTTKPDGRTPEQRRQARLKTMRDYMRTYGRV